MSAQKAAEEEAAAKKKGISQATDQLNTGFTRSRQGISRALQTTEGQFQPFTQGGQQAFGQQAAFSGAQGPEAQAQAFANFQTSPGQQFLQQRAEKALLRNAAATGNLGGGATQQALQEQAIGFAQADFGNQFNRLGQVAQQGGAFTSQLGGFRQGAAQNIANLRSGRDVNVANLSTQKGQVEAQRIADLQAIRASSGSAFGSALELGSAAVGAGIIPNPFGQPTE